MSEIFEAEMHFEPSDTSQLQAFRSWENPEVAIIRTSDRIAFKNCRRRWGWSSHLRHNLEPISAISPLWFGTGIHFALEDFHGWNKFGHPTEAFMAYVDARQRHDPQKTPDDISQLTELGHTMMDYYVLWLQHRKNHLLKTFWHKGKPQVEVNGRIQIPWPEGKFGIKKVYYSFTIDRFCIDDNNLLWPADYKTAKNMEILHFLTDPQINAYMWSSPFLYEGYEIGGFIYQQHRKIIPQGGRTVYNGTKVSTAQNQTTSSILYRQTVIDVYGSVEAAPSDVQNYLTGLRMQEDEDRDAYIRIDKIGRNERNAQAEGVKIMMEIEDMLNPDLPLYPNATRQCSSAGYSCPFLSPCTSLDDGSDWEHDLKMTTQPREKSYDSWRSKILWPGQEDPKKLDLGDRQWLE